MGKTMALCTTQVPSLPFQSNWTFWNNTDITFVLCMYKCEPKRVMVKAKVVELRGIHGQFEGGGGSMGREG